MGASSVIVIKEEGGQGRQLHLSGSALPLQGANWSGENSMSTDWNPGNTEATQHVLSPKDMPSSWDFEWRTVRLIRTPVAYAPSEGNLISSAAGIRSAHDLAIFIEDIFRGGVLLRVTWTNQVGDEIRGRQSRFGRATSWDFNYIRGDDIDASFEFEWIGRTNAQPKSSDVRGNSNLDKRQEAQRASEAAAQAILDSTIRTSSRDLALAPSSFTLGQLESIANAPLDLMNNFANECNQITSKVRKVGDIINTVKETPAAIAGRALDVANNAVAVTTTFLDEISREGIETQAARTKVSTLTRTAAYFSGAQTQADLMSGVYEELAAQSRRRRSALVPSAGSSRRADEMKNQDNFEVYIPRDGDTFAKIAKKFYEDADLGDEIAVANGYPAYAISPNTRAPLIIPTRTGLESSNRNRF